MTTGTFVGVLGASAVGLQVESAPATPAPAVGGICSCILVHQLHLNEMAGMDEAVGSTLLLPCDLGEASAVGPWRDAAGMRGLESRTVTQDEAERVVVAAIGGAEELPAFEGGIEGEAAGFGRDGGEAGGSSGCGCRRGVGVRSGAGGRCC